MANDYAAAVSDPQHQYRSGSNEREALRPTPPTIIALETLEKQVAALFHAIGKLEERLTPISLNEPRPAGASPATPPPFQIPHSGTSHVATAIDGQTRALIDATVRITQAIDRLEI